MHCHRNSRNSQSVSDNSFVNYPAATPGTVSYTANALNQYTAVGAVSPSYDGNGNLTSDDTFTLGYDASKAMVSMVDTLFRPILEGASAFEAERLWAEMYRQSIQAGRRGAALRAISAIDIALWDLRGKAARMPVMHLLGVHSTRLRCYATGGYYREGQTIAIERRFANWNPEGILAGISHYLESLGSAPHTTALLTAPAATK